MRDRGKLGTVACGVVVKFEEGHCEELHVLGHAEDLYEGISMQHYMFGVCKPEVGTHTAARKLDKVELFTLLWPCDMGGDEGVHEGLEVGSPPLRKRVADLPLVIDALARELCSDWRKALVQPRLEAFDLIVLGAEIVARAI